MAKKYPTTEEIKQSYFHYRDTVTKLNKDFNDAIAKATMKGGKENKH